MLSVAYSGAKTAASLTNLDPFVAARYAATNASDLISWIVSPAEAEALSKLKVASGSNPSLIQFVEDGITVGGLPVTVSEQVDAATKFWGIPKAHVVLVVRKGTCVKRFPNVQKDCQWVRAVSPLSIGLLNERGVVRGYDAA